MMRRFCSGSSTPARRAQEALARVDHHQPHPEVLGEGLAQQLRLALAHEAVVDVDAGQLIADGPMHEGRRHRAVDAAGEGADDVPAARPGRESRRPSSRPGWPASSCRALPRCRPRSCAARRGRSACARPRGGTGCRTGSAIGSARPAYGLESVCAVGSEALRRTDDRVAVAHPDRLLADRCRRRGRRASVRLTVAGPYSRFCRRHHLAAELVRHELQPVADAEDRDPARPERRVGARRIGVVDR